MSNNRKSCQTKLPILIQKNMKLFHKIKLVRFGNLCKLNWMLHCELIMFPGKTHKHKVIAWYYFAKNTVSSPSNIILNIHILCRNLKADIIVHFVIHRAVSNWRVWYVRVTFIHTRHSNDGAFPSPVCDKLITLLFCTRNYFLRYVTLPLMVCRCCYNSPEYAEVGECMRESWKKLINNCRHCWRPRIVLEVLCNHCISV